MAVYPKCPSTWTSFSIHWGSPLALDVVGLGLLDKVIRRRRKLWPLLSIPVSEFFISSVYSTMVKKRENLNFTRVANCPSISLILLLRIITDIRSISLYSLSCSPPTLRLVVCVSLAHHQVHKHTRDNLHTLKAVLSLAWIKRKTRGKKTKGEANRRRMWDNATKEYRETQSAGEMAGWLSAKTAHTSDNPLPGSPPTHHRHIWWQENLFPTVKALAEKKKKERKKKRKKTTNK